MNVKINLPFSQQII